MNEVIMTSTMLSVFYALVAVLGAWLMLRLLDRVSGVDFTKTMLGVCANEHSAAIYLGLRFMGVCILFGMVLS